MLGAPLEDLKHKLIETLEYPRYLVRVELALEDCPHDGQFDADDPRCRDCIDNEDCRWLFSSDEKARLDERPLDELVTALGFAIESIESLMEANKHDSLCQCDACVWRKQADALFVEVRCHPELGPPPIPH